ncbi:MAG TPA: flavin reductase family protein, partial [Longimicrobiales bacterium]|nr:flavin reductase family protein [Longimicrobiales bacterium]
RHLTTPIVAVTSSAEGRRNGMVANSAQRASLVPALPRISVYVSKINYTHDLVYGSGVFGIHLLRTDQWDLIWHLGLQSAREADKLASVAHEIGETGCPLLSDCLVAYECRVINAMDAGASTFFLGDVVSTREGRPGAVMTSEYFRANISEERKRQYEDRLMAAQKRLELIAGHIERTVWPGPTVRA